MRRLLFIVLSSYALAATSASPLESQDSGAGEWAKFKGELNRFAEDTLPKWGIEVKVDKPELADEAKGVFGRLPSHFKVTGGYEDQDTVKMSVETEVGRRKGLSVGFQGSFKSDAESKSVDGEGSISLPGGSAVKFKYSHEKGFEADLTASQQYTFASIGFGENADPFKVGIKAGPVTVKVDPVVYVKHFRQFAPKAIEAIEKKVGGVYISFDLGMMAMAMADAPPSYAKALSEVSFVSLKRLLLQSEANKAPDLGPITSVQGVLVDPAGEDVILVGRSEAWAPRIPFDVLLALLRSVWRDGLSPSVSIDRAAKENEDHLPRFDGVSPGLEQSTVLRILFDADYTMKRWDHGGFAKRVPGFLSFDERVAKITKDQLGFLHSVRFWFHPKPLAAGDVWRIDTKEGGLFLFETGVQLSTERNEPRSATLGTGTKSNPLYEDWARDVTAHFGEFERAVPIFKQLRQVFELSLACSLMRLSSEAKYPTSLLGKLCERPVSLDPHPKSFPVHHLEYKTLDGWTGAMVGGVVTERRSDRQRVLVVKELQGLFEKLRGAKWDGWFTRVDGAFQPIVRESQFAYRAAVSDAFLQDAEVEFHAGRRDEALVRASKAIRADPDSGEAYSLRAEILLGLARNAEALEDAEKAVRLLPGDYWTLLLRGVARYELKNYEGAIADSSTVLENRPQWAYAHMFAGLAKAGAGDFDGAIAAHTRVISLAPQHPFAYYHRANARAAKMDSQGAIDDFTKAIELDPNEAGLYEARGHVELVTKNFDVASKDFARAIELNPKHPLAYYGRGTCRYAKEDHQGAISDFGKVIELNPSLTLAYVARAGVELDVKDYKGAISDYSKAIELEPKNAQARRARGVARIALGDREGAGGDFAKAFELDLGNAKGEPADALNGLSELMNHKLYKEAAAYYEKLYESFPQSKVRPMAAYNAACGHALAGNPKRALDWLEKATESGFTDLEQIEKDDDLESIRKEDRYKTLLLRLKKNE